MSELKKIRIVDMESFKNHSFIVDVDELLSEFT